MNAPPHPAIPPDVHDAPAYAELHCLSNFSFQRGASSADELFQRARQLGYSALAITDECSLAGIVRALEASRASGVPLIVGSEIRLADGPVLVVLAADQHGYGELCRLITLGRRRSDKGRYHLTRADVEGLGDGVLLLWAAGARHAAATTANRDVDAAWLQQHFCGRAWIAVELHRGADDAAELAALRQLGATHQLPLVAAGDVHMHARGRRALQDVLTAIRLGCSVAEAGHALFPNGERHLRRRQELATLYPADLCAETLRVAAHCRFRLDGLNYQYPRELVPAGLDATTHLRQLTWAGAARRWPQGVPPAVRQQVEKELALIAELQYEPFFLTVHDIVAWARARQPPILCQGRGSSANSAVCYCLGITAVDPERGNLLFERFISRERDEPPDIDVDFEHERREEVIQYVFGRYGRERAALAATVIRYRGKSAARDVGRALGLPDDQLDGLSRLFSRLRAIQDPATALREIGLDPEHPTLRQWWVLVHQLYGFPRHLSQHVGGFVISERPLHHLVPVENAAMPGRTVIQWDKDDLETMKMLKVDCLALGMLTCLRKCFDLLRASGGPDLDLARIPAKDEATFRMIRKADTVGVFQIESRAQMSMLPRLRPRNFYDLVVQVAIVRPGPIQGDMVHPYLRRRRGEEAIEPMRPEVEAVLGRTFGVPIFQEQVMKLVEVAAGFTPGQADQLRRAMAAWKRRGGLEPFRERIFAGMRERGYDADWAARIFEQIKGFGDYGFPESHAASFALLAYVSSWLKCHHPAAFACALLNSQPMGFYQPAQIVQDAQHHGVRVLPVDVVASRWDCTLEVEPDRHTGHGTRGPGPAFDAQTRRGWEIGVRGRDREQDDRGTATVDGGRQAHGPRRLALRLGLRMVHGLSSRQMACLLEARAQAPFRDVTDLLRRSGIDRRQRGLLAEADALRTLGGHRHQAHWESTGLPAATPLLAGADGIEERVAMPAPSLGEEVLRDYASQGLSLQGHPMALLRDRLRPQHWLSAAQLSQGGQARRRVRAAGLVTARQHPSAAAGVTFVTIEDETGSLNVVVWRALGERQHRELAHSVILGVDGVLEATAGVTHLIAHRLHDLGYLLPGLATRSRDFH